MSSSITAENKQTPAGIQEQNQENSKQTLGTPISFQFQPFNYEKSQHYIQKSDESGKQRKYICGISSGVKIDHHNERMTEKCIKSFMDQTNNGQLLLYPDIHGIKSSKDIGILTKSEILGDGDWYTEYRLYDEDDDVDTESLQTAKKIWKQMRGESPYKKPIQKGFSIEGYIPDTAILHAEKDSQGNIRNRVIDDVLLDGVVLVPRQAYKPAIANAVYKALGELYPLKKEKIIQKVQSTFEQKLASQELTKHYYQSKFKIDDVLSEVVKDIMVRKNDTTKKEQLEIALKEYSDYLINLILNAEDLFNEENEHENDETNLFRNMGANTSHVEICKSLISIIKSKMAESKNSQAELYKSVNLLLQKK